MNHKSCKTCKFNLKVTGCSLSLTQTERCLEITRRPDGVVLKYSLWEPLSTMEVSNCPFCGHKAIVTDFGNNNLVVTCSNCSAETDSVEDWERRVKFT